MTVVEFPTPDSERWKLEQGFDNMRFDIQSAQYIANHLRSSRAIPVLAANVPRETIEDTLIHLGSLIAFLSELKDEMEGNPESHHAISESIRHAWDSVQE